MLFCGTHVPEEIEYQVRDISAAGNRFQNNMILNLKKCGHDVTECAYIGVFVPEGLRGSLSPNTVLKSSGFLKSLMKYRSTVKKLLGDSDVVMCYNVTYAWLFLPFWAHRRHKKSVVIVADYSEAVSASSFFGKLYARLQGISMRHFDTVVGLSGNIERKLKRGQSFLLMEGGIDCRLYDSFSYMPHKTGKELVLLYSGLLSPVTGVDRLLEVMKAVGTEKIRLLISGKGILEEEVRRAAEKDARICFLGHLPYEEYVRQLGSADILINPRNMEFPENQNNFPSKIMDYLAAGKRILSTRFAGWERFREYIDFCDSYEEMAGRINEFVARLDAMEGKEIFCRNRGFAETFLWENQLARILDREL